MRTTEVISLPFKIEHVEFRNQRCVFIRLFSNRYWTDSAPQGRGHRSFYMKKIFTALVLATLVATPAVAKQRHTITAQAAAAQAYVPRDYSLRVVDRYTVVVNGHIVGRDPDPNVRLMLLRDSVADAS
jgi:hypothetical protein